MKTTDLQIGDWVKIDYNNQKVKVTAVYNNWIDTSSISPLMSKVSPIPLTPEILERNGFKYFEECNSYILLTDDLDSVVLTLNGLTVIFHWHNIPITCVHQLQHALRLCGLNDLADNLKLEE